MLYCGMQFTRIHAKDEIGLLGEREKMKRLEELDDIDESTILV